MRFLICWVFTVWLILGFSVSSVIAQVEKPLSLADAVALTLQSNRALGASRFDANAAKYSAFEAWSEYLPQIDYVSNYDETVSERFEVDAPPQADGDMSNQVLFSGFSGADFINQFQLRQLIFDFSVIGNIQLARLQRRAAQWQEAGQEQVSVNDTIIAFLDVLRAKELLEVQEQRLALAEEQLYSATTNLEAGRRIRTDVLRAELTRSSAERDVVSAEIQVEQALANLKRILGVDLQRRVSLQPGLLDRFDPPEAIDTTIRDYNHMFRVAIMENPAIQVASLLVDQREESLDIARGEFLPSLEFSAAYGYNESGALKLRDEEYNLALSATMPIFEGGRRVAKVSRTKEQLSAEKQRYEDTVRAVLNRVEVGSLSLMEEKRNLTIALKSEAVAHENHRRFLNLFNEGLADSLDVTQALTELVEARTDVVTARYNYMSEYTVLLQNLGVIPTKPEVYQSVAWLNQLNHPPEIDGRLEPQ